MLLAAAWTPAGAKVRLPAVVGDNMVLQQATDVKVWGWAAPGSEVRVAPSWGAAVRTEADAEGRWCTTLRTPAASFEKRTIRIGDGDGSAQASDEWQSGGNLARMVATLQDKGADGYALYRYDNLFNSAYPELAAAETAALTGANAPG